MKTAPAFSLIEVVIALGIISFGLISMLGLLSVGMSSDRSSGEDTAISAMATRRISELKGAQNSGQLQSLAAPAFFDVQGAPTSVVASRYYSCQALLSTTNLASPPAPDMSLVRLRFVWPVASLNPPHTNTVYATLPFAY